jgi:pimeloyl-ACP methyl ester carboxylesterase
MKHAFADLNGIRMHYVTHGDGVPVLLLHGFPEYWGAWKQVMADLGTDHHVIAPDLRGYNLTSRPSDVEQYRIEHLVEDLRALVAHLGLKRKVTIVSQDWGAFVGWSFVLRHPELVERFVTIDVTHPALFNEELQKNPAQQQASQYMLAFRGPGGEALVTADDFAFPRQALFGEARQYGAVLSDADIAEWVDAWKQPGAITAGLNYYRAARIGPPDGQGSSGGSNLVDGLTPEQLQVKLPVLVLRAEGDAYLLPSGLEGLIRYVSDLSVRRIPDATHWLALEKPALVSRLVREFVRRDTR